MIVEHIKSVVLFLLVVLSLLLTFALWTYQPQYEDLQPPNYVEVTRLDGEEQSIKDIIYPEKILFHNYQEHKQFNDKQEEAKFYEEIKNWSFSSIDTYLTSNPDIINRYMEWTEVDGWVRNNHYQSVEIHYPVQVPMDLINQIFTINKVETAWNQSFNKIFLYLDHTAQGIQVIFASDQHQEVLLGEIQSSTAYEKLESLLDRQQMMVNLEQYKFKNGHSFYLPIERLGMESHSLLTKNLSVEPLKNVLFRDPSLVSRTYSSTLNESLYLTDGTRLLITYPVFKNDHIIKFVNPLSSEHDLTPPSDLVQRSLKFTNDHTGWTDEYKLDQIKEEMSMVKYRMYFDGYPIFDSTQITEIEQLWRNNELYQLKRPLFQTGQDFSSEEEHKRLPSGEAVYSTLTSLEDRISLDQIDDIRIGYHLNTRNNVSSSVLTLEPEWHIKFRDSWRPLSYFNEMLVNQGVE